MPFTINAPCQYKEIIYALSFSVLMSFGWPHSVMLTPTYSTISYRISFLGIFGTLRKATISFTTSVHSSIRMEKLGSNWTEFHEL